MKMYIFVFHDTQSTIYVNKKYRYKHQHFNIIAISYHLSILPWILPYDRSYLFIQALLHERNFF